MRILLTILFLLLAQNVTAQTRLGTPLNLSWNYTLADITAGTVVRFEVRVDTGSYVNTGLPPTAVNYVFPLPTAALTVGNHVAAVRACSLKECGLEATVLFTVLATLPATPANPRVSPGSTVPNENLIELVKAYALVAADHHITNSELIELATSYRGPVPPTRESVFNHIDAQIILRHQ